MSEFFMSRPCVVARLAGANGSVDFAAPASSGFAPFARLLFFGRDGREVFLLLEGLEAALEIVGQRRRVIERAGVQPHAIRSLLPGAGDGWRQQVLAEAAPEEFLQQSEVSNLSRAVRVALKLEVARRRAFDNHQPERHLGPR